MKTIKVKVGKLRQMIKEEAITNKGLVKENYPLQNIKTFDNGMLLNAYKDNNQKRNKFGTKLFSLDMNEWNKFLEWDKAIVDEINKRSKNGTLKIE